MPETKTISIILVSETDSLAENLEAFGLKVSKTSDGFSAIRLAIENRPDAVVIDNITSGLPAPTIAIWLKLNPKTSNIPIVGITQAARWQEARVDAEHDLDNELQELVGKIQELITAGAEWDESGSMEDSSQAIEPLDITMDLIEVYRERLLLAGAMIELASLQHDLGDFEYTISSILEAAGLALDCNLIGITLLRENTHYSLVRGTEYTRLHLTFLEGHSETKLEELLDKQVDIDNQLVIGRRRLGEPTGNEQSVGFIGHPIYSRGQILGYLTGLTSDPKSGTAYYHGLLPDLTAQIALLLVNADLISAQESYVDELSSILRAAVETSSISTLSETTSKSFLLQFLLIILELCHTDRGCVILFNEETGEISETASLGVEANDVLSTKVRNNKTLAEDLISFPPGEVLIDQPNADSHKLSRIIAPLSAGETNVGGLVIFGKNSKISPRIVEAIKALASLAGYLAYNRTLHHKNVESSIIEDQLNTAREVQIEMLPDRPPDYPGYDINGISQPAKEVGGDFFDYFPSDNHLTIGIGDVCGKSIPASLLMTMTRALYLASTDSADSPEKVLEKVNSLLTRSITQGKFVTGSLMRIGREKISYASAGHQPLLVYRAKDDRFEEINTGGIALGILESYEFEKVEFSMETGDIALMYTDGLNEAMNVKREMFGYENIKNVIRKNAENQSAGIITALKNAMLTHANGVNQHDDTTIVIVKKIHEGDEKHVSGNT